MTHVADMCMYDVADDAVSTSLTVQAKTCYIDVICALKPVTWHPVCSIFTLVLYQNYIGWLNVKTYIIKRIELSTQRC